MVFFEALARFLRALRNLATLILEVLLTGRNPWTVYDSPCMGRFALMAMLGLAILPISFQLWPLIVGASGARDEFKRRLVESDRLHLAPEVLDSAGRFISALPSYNPRVAENEAYFGNKLSARGGLWNTVFVERPNPHFLECVTLLEDQYYDNRWLNPHGLDLSSFPRAPYRALKKGELSARALGGGSTLTAQFQQQLGVRKDRENEFVRKIREMSFRTADMADVIGRDWNRYNQLAARVLPHVTNVSGHGDTVHGTALASRILFGKPQEALNEAEAYLLASAVRIQVKFRYRFRYDEDGNVTALNEEGIGKRLNIWQKHILFRAGQCASNGPLRRHPERRDAVLAQIDRWKARLPHPKVNPVVNAYGRLFFARTEGKPDLWYDPARDPLDHASALMKQSLDGLRIELRNAFGYDWGALVNRVQLSMDIRDERRFVPAFEARAKSWLRGLEAQGRLHSCYGDWARWSALERFQVQSCADIPEVIVAAADEDGRIVRYYSSREQQSYFGSEDAKTKLGDMSYDASKETRQLASVAKIGAAHAFVRAGETGPDVRRAIAASDTDEITHLLSSRIRNLGIISEELFRQLRWSHTSSQRKGIATRDLPSIALSRGTVAASPRTVHHDVSALLNAFMNRDRPVYAPTMVRQVTYLDYPAGRTSGGHSRLPDYHTLKGKPLSPWQDGHDPAPGEIFPRIEAAIASPDSTIDPVILLPHRQRGPALALLRAPFCDVGGTLHSLRAWCGPAKARLIFGKSGTHDVSNSFAAGNPRYRGVRGIVQALWLAGGVQLRDGRGYSFVFLVAGSRKVPLTLPRRPGDSGLEASATAPLLQFILEDLERHPSATEAS
jgi:hypothetical protein